MPVGDAPPISEGKTFIRSKLFIYLLYPMLSFAVHLILAIVFCSRWWQAVAWTMANSAFGGNLYINWVASMVAFSICFASQASAIGIIITFVTENIYKDEPYFHADKRPKYDPEQRLKGHQICFRNFLLGGTIQLLTSSPMNHPMHWHMPPKPFNIAPFPEVDGIRSALFTFVLMAILVQSALVLSDVMYGVFHRCQHKYKFLHKYTGHYYHHTFVYPLAMCGPWLAPGDIAASALATFILPVEIPMSVFGIRDLMGCTWAQSFVFDSLLHGYIHEMNDYDHSGKQVPSWSGFPFCPPLGFALGLHKSIPNHEAHHNFSTCGFGLLGVADWLMGTSGSPDMKSKLHTAKEQ